jgi:hypothetical protein
MLDWLFQHGVLPLYTLLLRGWLTLAESPGAARPWSAASEHDNVGSAPHLLSWLITIRMRRDPLVAPGLCSGDDAAGLTEYTDAPIEAIGDRRDLILAIHSRAFRPCPSLPRRPGISVSVLQSIPAQSCRTGRVA